MNKTVKVFIVVLVMLISCKSSGEGLYETFYIGNNKSQYFIKPMQIENNNDDLFKFDMTYRKESPDSVLIRCNFSLFAENAVVSIDSMIINKKHKFEQIEKLYAERKSGKFLIRSTTNFDYDQFIYFYRTEDININLYSGSNTYGFEFNGSLNKKREKIDETLLPMLDYNP